MNPDLEDEHVCSADVAAYALEALEAVEAEAFREHLQTCTVCPVQLRAVRQIVDDLAIGVPRVTAPSSLRRRVIHAVEQEPRAAADRPEARPEEASRTGRRRRDEALRSSRWLRGPAAALGAGIAFALAAIVVVVIVFPGRPNVRTVHAQTTGRGTAALHISANRTELVVHHIPAPPRGKIYEVWIQHGKEQPRRSALFGVDRNGDASIEVAGSSYGVSHVMVTAEPAPHGTRAPTAEPVISASLS